MSIFRSTSSARSTGATHPAGRRHLALTTAAGCLVDGGDLGRARTAVAAAGVADAHPRPEDLVVAAQRRFWSALLGRLDERMGDDLALWPQELRLAEVRLAWAELTAALPGHWELALSLPDDPTVTAGLRRYCRLLALFAGLARPADPEDMATAAGAHLVADLSSQPMAEHLAEAFVTVPTSDDWTRLGA